MDTERTKPLPHVHDRESAEVDQSPVRASLRRRRSRGLGLVLWTGLVVAVVGVAAWPFAAVGWVVDLVAQLTAHAVMVAGVLTVLAAGLRRWRLVLVAAGAVAVGGVGLMQGRAWTLAPATPGVAPVRVLVYNALSANTSEPARVRGCILGSDADIVALLEPPDWLIEELKAGGAWREAYPWYWVAPKAEAGFKVLMSRWPQRSTDTGVDEPQRTALPGFREAIIDRPGGAFVFALIQPKSPRSAARWAEGNAVFEALARRRGAREAATGLPIVVAGDLNATPTGHRSGLASARLGLRRAKPLLVAAGTFPGAMPWPLRIAIDDALVGPGTRVVGWRVVDGAGSDHAAVIIELEVPAP